MQHERCHVCRRQLSNASTDSSDLISKYQTAEAGRSAALSERQRLESDLRAQLSQAEQRLSQAQSKLSQAEQQASDAQAALARERQQFEHKLQQAQAEVRAAPQANASATLGELTQHGSRFAKAVCVRLCRSCCMVTLFDAFDAGWLMLG